MNKIQRLSILLVSLCAVSVAVHAATVTPGTDDGTYSASAPLLNGSTDKALCSQSARGPRVNLPGSGNPDGGIPFDPCATADIASTDIGTQTPTPNAIPVAVDGGTLDPGWLPTDTTYGSGTQHKAAIWSASNRLKAAVNMVEDENTGAIGVGGTVTSYPLSVYSGSYPGTIEAAAIGWFAGSSVGQLKFNGSTGNTELSATNATGGSIELAPYSSAKEVVVSPGRLRVGNSTNSSTNPQVLVSSTVDDTGSGNNHAFVDGSIITRSGEVAYASFDATAEFDGGSDYDHYVSYQSRGIFGSSGSISKLYGFYDSPTVEAGSTASDRYGAYLADVMGSGTLSNNYGLYVASLTLGTNKWGVYTDGSMPSYFGGALGIGINAPAAPLHVIAASTADQALVQRWGYNVVAESDYNLRLKTTVGAGVVRWGFDQTNAGTTYADTFVMDRGSVGLGIATGLSARLTLAGIGNGGLVIRNASSTNDRLQLFVGDGTGGYAADENYLINTNTPLHMMTGPYGTVPVADFSSSAIASHVPLELKGATSGTLTMDWPDAITSYTLTWPAATADGYLKNTSGALSFGAPAFGDLGLSLSSGVIPYYNGTTLADSPLKSNGTQLLIGGSSYRASTALEIIQDGAAVIQRTGNASGYATTRWMNDQNSTARALEAGYTGSSYAGWGGLTGEFGYLGTSGAYNLALMRGTAFQLVLQSGFSAFKGKLWISNVLETAAPPGYLEVTDASTKSPGGLINLSWNETGSATEWGGIRFGIRQHNYPNEYMKGGLIYSNMSGYGRGRLCLAVENVNDASNVDTGDCALSVSGLGATRTVTFDTLAGNAGKFVQLDAAGVASAALPTPAAIGALPASGGTADMLPYWSTSSTLGATAVKTNSYSLFPATDNTGYVGLPANRWAGAVFAGPVEWRDGAGAVVGSCDDGHCSEDLQGNSVTCTNADQVSGTDGQITSCSANTRVPIAYKGKVIAEDGDEPAVLIDRIAVGPGLTKSLLGSAPYRQVKIAITNDKMRLGRNTQSSSNACTNSTTNWATCGGAYNTTSSYASTVDVNAHVNFYSEPNYAGHWGRCWFRLVRKVGDVETEISEANIIGAPPNANSGRTEFGNQTLLASDSLSGGVTAIYQIQMKAMDGLLCTIPANSGSIRVVSYGVPE